VNIRSVIFIAALFSLTHVAFADGTYQKTRDGKTLVWNNNPEPGDQATWSGKRDENGYASGQGTLTWYRTQKKIVTGSNVALSKYLPVASYTGEMARGKLNGAVAAVDANGKKFHGTYADGRRKKWLAGAAKETAPNEPMSRRGELVEAPGEGPDETKPAEAAPVQSSAPKSSPVAKPAEFDDSLRSLVGPPASLRDDTHAGARSTSSSSPAPEKSKSPSALDITTGIRPEPAASIAPSPH
jgi:hypothetical protein